MKVYEITKRKNAPNVFGISLVAEPAMESDYVKLSKENTDKLSEDQKIELSNQYDIQFSEVDKEKRLLLGLVLEPNKLIYRYDPATKEEYYITVNEETILELAHDYIKNSNQNYSTLEHDGRELDGVTFVEHWTVEDSKVDKSALHGLSFKKGSWVTVAKIENDTLWNDYVKTGRVMGFSIDAMVHLEEVKLNKNNEMSDTKTILEVLKDLPNQIKLALTPKQETEEEKAAALTLKKEADKKKAKELALLSETDKKEALELEEFTEALKSMGVEFSGIVKDSIETALKPVKDENISLKKEVEELTGKVVELGKEPETKPIKSKPEAVDFSKMTNLEKMMYKRENA